MISGFPRTVSQAEALWGVQKLDVVFNLVVPFSVIVDRVKGRWIHLPSGRVYNTDFNAPKVPVSPYFTFVVSRIHQFSFIVGKRRYNWRDSGAKER